MILPPLPVSPCKTTSRVFWFGTAWISSVCTQVSSGRRLLNSSSTWIASGDACLRLSGRLYSPICFSSWRCKMLAASASLLALASIGCKLITCCRICHSGKITSASASAAQRPASAQLIQLRFVAPSPASARDGDNKSSGVSASAGDNSNRLTVILRFAAASSSGATRVFGAATSSTRQVPALLFRSTT